MQISVKLKRLSRLPFHAGAELAECSYAGLQTLIIDADEAELDRLEQTTDYQQLNLSLWQATFTDAEQLSPALQPLVNGMPLVRVCGEVVARLGADQLLLKLADHPQPLHLWCEQASAVGIGQRLCLQGELHATLPD